MNRVGGNRRFAKKQATEFRRQPHGSCWMVEQDSHKIVACPSAAASEDRFFLVVVEVGHLYKSPVFHSPPGQSASRLFDVVFGVIADAEREQLQQFASEVFVGSSAAICRCIEIDQQRRIT